MRRFSCSCKNCLFFDNIFCIKCKHEVGWCPSCKKISDVLPQNAGGYSCVSCNALLVKCNNYASFNVCNRFVLAPMSASLPPTNNPTGAPLAPGSIAPAPVALAPLPLCDCCRFNRTIPDLTVEGNREKWARLESAKRRTLYDLTMLRLPFGDATDNITPALGFEFKGDLIADQIYRGMGDTEKVFTGHDSGIITINIQEADDAAREKLRVDLHEAQRSLLGHFRHEFGHYIWDVTVKGNNEAEFISIFGDHNNPTYDIALQAYYQNGPKSDWLLNYVSAYSTMHPWEDFAETFAVYLDMASALDTAFHNGLIPEVKLADLDWMVTAYQKLGIALNEMNRCNGLLDYLPEVFAPPVKAKLQFIHRLALAPLAAAA